MLKKYICNPDVVNYQKVVIIKDLRGKKPKEGSRARRIFDYMSNAGWANLNVVAKEMDIPHSSLTAELRNFRKPKKGSHTVEKKRVSANTYLYRLTPNKG